MVASSPDEFRAAVRDYRFDDHSFEADVLSLARASLDEAGLLTVGEEHGRYETPSMLYSLGAQLGTRGVAFEWSHEEVDEVLHEFVRTGSFDYERLWSLPSSAEFFCGDGRITSGHFALLERLRQEGRLEQAIAFDRLDPDPVPEWPVRDREMAERLLAEWDERVRLMVVAGAFHARLEEGTLASHLARERPGLQPVLLDYVRRTPPVVPGSLKSAGRRPT